MPHVQVHIFSMNRMERIVLNAKITHCARRVIGGTALDGYLIQEVLKEPLQLLITNISYDRHMKKVVFSNI